MPKNSNTTRTGVVINKGDGRRRHQEDDNDEEDIEKWMDDAKSPAATADDNDKDEEANEEEDLPSKKSSSSRRRQLPTVKTPKSSVDMLLKGGGSGAVAADGDDDSNNDGDDGSSSHGKKSTGRVRRYASKLRETAGGGAKGGDGITSPSELSRVSTLPPTPFESGHEGEEKEDHVDDNDNDGAEDIEEVLVDSKNDDHEEEEAVVKNSADANINEQPDDQLHPESPQDDDFPAGGGFDDDDQDDGEDLGPPAHQDDTTDDENSRMKVSGENEGSGEGINGLDSDNENDREDGDDFGEDDKEGPGFNMVHDPETPHSVRQQRAQREREDIRQARQRNEDDARTADDDGDDDDESNDLSEMKRGKGKEKKKRKKKKKKVTAQRRGPFSPKGIPGPRSYQHVPFGNLPSPDPDGPRRSKRRKIRPLEYWKNERVEFGANNEDGAFSEAFGDMPVIKSVQYAEDTPYKKRKDAGISRNVGQKKTKTNDEVEVEEFDVQKLKRKYTILEGTEANVWDDQVAQAESMKVLDYDTLRQLGDLSLPKNTKKSKGKTCGKVSQAFLAPPSDIYPGYLMGTLVLPPHAAKYPESVGGCAQTFTVVSCQPIALEVSFADPDELDGEFYEKTAQRFVLSSGDIFRVPPGNTYQIINHSKSVDAKLTWTIIRPMEHLGMEEDSE
mmetsp:Transcript_48744/g.117940  ORF Transcript_48744/g.117940 Transcript_48744/m.117940 type:complete len:672 (+) Transcript_48744:332-2347(+)